MIRWTKVRNDLANLLNYPDDYTTRHILIDLYCHRNWTLEQIACVSGVSRNTVRAKLALFDVQIKLKGGDKRSQT